MLEEFSESQLQLVQLLLDREAKTPGWVAKVLGSAEKIENILDYNGNVVEVLVGVRSGREMQKNEKKRMTVKYLLIEYYTLMKRMDRLPRPAGDRAIRGRRVRVHEVGSRRRREAQGTRHPVLGAHHRVAV